MKRPSIFPILLAYLRQRLFIWLLFLLFAGIFAVVFWLYALPVEAVGYACLLSAVLGFICGLFDFYHYYQKHWQLVQLQHKITISLSELPNTNYLIEQDYQKLLQLLSEEMAHRTLQSDIAKQDLISYYTLWAHQIKTPIAAMHLLLQTEDTPQNAELDEQLFKIEQYVQMVLQYLRLNSHSSDFIIRKYDLDAIIKQAIHKYAKLFVRKKITLNYTPCQCTVLTDEKWLGFVIEQLLSNALKYTHTGSISIYLQPDSKTLVIADTGIGIAPEDLPRVFEQGYTGYNGRQEQKSTGIGLYLCKQIMQKLSHTIVIQSQVGIGTKVYLNLKELDVTIE